MILGVAKGRSGSGVPHQVEPRQRPRPRRTICHSVPIRSCTRMIPSEVWPRNTKYAYLSSTCHLLDPRDQSPADQVVGSACDGRGTVWVFPC